MKRFKDEFGTGTIIEGFLPIVTDKAGTSTYIIGTAVLECSLL